MNYNNYSIQSNVTKIIGELESGALRRAVLAGGEVIRNYAKLNIRSTFSAKSKGVAGLAGSMIVTVVKDTKDMAEVDVGPTKVYGRIQELGGIIKPVFAKMLSWVNDAGVRVFARQVRLPPRPYLRPAMENNVDTIIRAVKAQLSASISASVEKI